MAGANNIDKTSKEILNAKHVTSGSETRYVMLGALIFMNDLVKKLTCELIRSPFLFFLLQVLLMTNLAENSVE